MARSTAGSNWITSTASRAPFAKDRNLSLMGLTFEGGEVRMWPDQPVGCAYTGAGIDKVCEG